MRDLAKLDQEFVWHPFTQMKDWLRGAPRVILSGKGALLYDQKGREYIDGNSSIWTNLHGHRNRRMNRAVRQQMQKIAHSSALGLANEPAALLGEKLVNAAKGSGERPLRKVFYSDDGSTAMECALKLSYEYWRRRGVRQPRFLSLQSGYHGDTIGAVSLGHIDLFHKAYEQLLFKTDKVMAPYCYRCPFNRAKAERADARQYRKCKWECTQQVERRFEQGQKRGRPITAFVVEPLMQGAAGMIAQPEGWLRRVWEICRSYRGQFIADEVLTGFGRASPAFVLAAQSEGVTPDLVGLAKGLTGGYLPMGATLTTQDIFEAFLGEYEEFKTFFHGHSYTGNQLAAAAALESLKMLSEPGALRQRLRLQEEMKARLADFWRFAQVGDIRQVGSIAGIELVRNWRTREPFDLKERVGIRVCEAMAEFGVLTRPIGNVVVIMPPYCITPKQLEKTFQAFEKALEVTFGARKRRGP